MKTLLSIVLSALLLTQQAIACSIFTVVRDGKVLMGNNEDFTLPGVIWFVPASDGKLGRVNVGFDDSFAQGSMNEKGLSFDGAALQEVAWEEDPEKPSPDNLVELIMNECATVAEAITYFEEQNCRFLRNAQIMFADATGDSAVITWLPEKGLSVVRIEGDHQIVTNDRLEQSGFRDPRFVRAEQVLAERSDASLDTMTEVMHSIHQHGPGAFTSYSCVYDLKNQKMFLYNLANYDEAVEFDLKEELAKGPALHKMRSLFEDSPKLRTLKKMEQRSEYGTRIDLPETTLERYAGRYAPTVAPDKAFSIEVTDGLLRVINPGQPDALLYPESETVFRLHPNPGQVSFQIDATGAVTGLTLHRAIDLVATRVD